MSTKFDKYVQLYNKITDGESIVPESREEAFDLALVMKLKGVSSDESILNSKSKLSKYMNLYKDIINGEDIVPETREEAIKLALIRSHGNGGGGTGGSVDLSNYYRKSQTYSRTEVDSKLGTKANSTDVYSKTETENLLGNKVDKVDGKGLSQENYTTEEKTKVAGLKNYDDTAVKNRLSIIEGKYADKDYVLEQLSKIEGLTREIVTVLPTADVANDSTIYMLKVTGASGDEYEMYMKIEGNIVLIGTTTVDLTGYAKTSDLPTKTSDLTNDSGFLTEHQDISGKVDKIAGKGLSENDFTDALKSNYDNAASKAHSHNNSSVLEKFSEDASGTPLYNGTIIAGGLDDALKAEYDGAVDKAHTHDNAAVLAKFSEDANGKVLFDGSTIASTTGDYGDAKVLWENPDPTAAITTMDIELYSDDYDILDVYYNWENTGAYSLIKSYYKGGHILISESSSSNGLSSGGFYNISRTILRNDDTSFSICRAYFHRTTLVNEEDGSKYLIPVKIVGRKMVKKEWTLLAEVTLANNGTTTVNVDSLSKYKEFTVISKLSGYNSHMGRISFPNIMFNEYNHTVRNMILEPEGGLTAYFRTIIGYIDDRTITIDQLIGSSWNAPVEVRFYGR